MSSLICLYHRGVLKSTKLIIDFLSTSHFILHVLVQLGNQKYMLEKFSRGDVDPHIAT